MEIINLLFSFLGALSILSYFYIGKLQERWKNRNIEIEVPPSIIWNTLVISIFGSTTITFNYSGFAGFAAFALGALFFAALLASYIDWHTCKIPNELMLLPSSLIILAGILDFNLQQVIITSLTLGMILFASLVTNFITKGKLGGGDIKLLLMFGLISYWFNPMTIFYGMLISFVLQLLLRILWNKKRGNINAKGAPFGYALSIGIIQALLIF